jgi:hypothetical protein
MMRYTSLEDFVRTGAMALAKGPIAVILAEDAVEVSSTVRHNLKAGFVQVLLLTDPEVPLDVDLEPMVHRIAYDALADQAMMTAVNRLIEAAPGLWFYACFNAEYLFYPFCETRNIRELLAFHTEERRDAVLSYVVDLYADDLHVFPNAVSLDRAHLDRSGYYALARPDPLNHNHPKQRQLDFFGGLRWRFEEHVPLARRKIDRISLFRAKPGLEMRPDFTFTDEEYNTYACPWHNTITATVASFRTAKALKTNSGSKFAIQTFRWHNSVAFTWHSQQLMDLGLMEPGQWF